MHVSKKNQPVLDRLILLLAQSENVADAILDNALDDGERVDPEVVAGLTQYLVRIADILNAAEQADLKPLSNE
jgi:hypothetical protein|tara:strand:- start:380 stop:598 length:219 start_codon:yes stop_codon:yes gene_type:complete